MTIATIPSVFYEFAFNADPNQGTVPPNWLDLSSRVQFGWNTTRGKQYESDVNETGVWNVELANADGAVDPGNASSPYWPNVIPYRRCRIRMPLGANLLAPDQASGGEWSPLAAGPLPAWLGASSASGYPVTVAVVGGAAFQGTQTFAVAVPAAGAATKGLWQAPVPTVTAGGAYTFSAQVQVTTSGQNPQIYVSISWLTTAGAVALSVSSTATTVTGGAGTWTALSVSGTAPAAAVAAVVSVNTASAIGAPTVVWVDGLQLENRSYATRWQMPWRAGVNQLPQTIATGLETLNPVSDTPTRWFNALGTLGGLIQQATNLTAAPSGQTSAVKWVSNSGTTSSNSILAVGNSTNAAGPVADTVQVTGSLSYTASAYLLRAASADATIIVTPSIVWYDQNANQLSVASGSGATVTTASWVRATVTGTAPATAVWGRLQLAITTPATTTAQNTIYATGLQFEQAASVSTWADPGVTAFVFNGYVERWPNTYNEADGTYGTAQLECVDAFSALAQFTLQPPYINELLILSPNYLFELAEAAGSTAVVDSIGNRTPAPVENGPRGAGSLVFGNAVTATSPTTGGFVGASGPVATFANDGALISPTLHETFISLHKTTAAPGPPTAGAWTRIIAFRTSQASDINHRYSMWNAASPTSSCQFEFRLENTASGTITASYVDKNGTSFTVANAFAVNDGNWHLLGLGVNPSTGNGTAWLDGVSFGSAGGLSTPSGITSDTIGCEASLPTSLYQCGWVGDLALAVELPALLTNTQMANLYNSWRSASKGESSGSRYARVLTWIGWTGAAVFDNGQTTSMGPATDLIGSSALDAENLVALTENGDHYVSASGALTFKARSAFYNTRTPAVVFGEGPPVGNFGEWPVEYGSFDFDPSHLASAVQVQNYGGSLYQVRNAAAARKYFPRVYARQVNTTSTSEPQDAATYLLGQLSTPRKRVDTVRWHVSAQLGALPVAAQIDKGVRVRTMKRPVGAAATSLDVFTQKVDWTWDPSGDVWVEYQASPADLLAYGVLAALHTTLNAQATAGASTATINALPDAAYNKLAQSLPSGYQLTFEPGTARAETLTIAAGGIPSTSLGYSTAVLTFTSTFAFTHAAGTVVCEPLPTGYTDPTTWDASAVIGATSTTVVSGGTSGTATVTVAALPDAAYNGLGSTWNTNDQVTLSPGTVNAETMTILSVAASFPGYTSCQLTFTANLAHSHAVGDTVCDPLPAGISTPAALAPTLRLAY